MEQGIDFMSLLASETDEDSSARKDGVVNPEIEVTNSMKTFLVSVNLKKIPECQLLYYF